MSKIIKIFIFFVVILFVFNKQIISQVLLYSFSKWTDREIEVDKFQINYRKNFILIEDAKIKNLNEFYYNNFIEVDKIFLSYDFKSLFSHLIIVNDLTVENPKFYLELIEKSSVELSPNKIQQIYHDNVGESKKIVKRSPSKIWPKKSKDKNFLILEVKINAAKVFIKTFLYKDPTKIDLSNIYHTRVGNGGGEGGTYIHHKSVLKSEIIDLIATIPDLKLRNFLDKIYNSKTLYMR